MGLDEYAVDLGEADGAGLCPHGLDERAEAEVARPAQEPLGGAHDERQRVLREGVVSEAGLVELVEQEPLRVLRRQARQQDGVGNRKRE